MSIVVYLTIFLIPTLFFIKYYKNYKITMLEYEIIATIDIINSLDRDPLVENRKKYPEFYKVIESIFNKDYNLLKFEHIKKSVRVVGKQTSEKINKEISDVFEEKDIFDFILYYRKLCLLMYLHQNFKKYLIVELLVKILPEKERKEIKEKEKEKASDLCLA